MKIEMIKMAIMFTVVSIILWIGLLFWYEGVEFNRYILIMLLVFMVSDRIEVTAKKWGL